jgi:hypothetical protein
LKKARERSAPEVKDFKVSKLRRKSVFASRRAEGFVEEEKGQFPLKTSKESKD